MPLEEASEQPGMELRLESRALNEAVEATAQFFKTQRVKAELPTCQLLIVLVRETQVVVQEAMQAYADAVIFKSSPGTGKGDFVQALHTLSEGGVYFPEEIRQLGAAQASNPNLPPLIEELTNQGIGSSLGTSVEL